MSQLGWLISPLVTAIFFTLGIILFYHVLFNAAASFLATSHRFAAKSLVIMRYMGAVFFVALSAGLHLGSWATHDAPGFITFKILCLCYALIYLGHSTALWALGAGVVMQVILFGAQQETIVDIIIGVTTYLTVSIVLYIARYWRYKHIAIVALMTASNGLLWGVLYLIPSPLFTVVDAKDAFYHFSSFAILNLFTYIAVRWLNRESDLYILATHEARIDGLTRIGNFHSFEGDFSDLYTYHSAANEPLSMIAIDIDYFKKINDTYGHPAGNEILKLFGTVIKQATSKLDGAQCYRTGGEEFAILLPGVTVSRALTITRTLRKSINLTDFTIGNTSIPVTASYGVGQLRSSDTTPLEFYERTDSILYQAKRHGRDRISSETEPVDDDIAAHLMP